MIYKITNNINGKIYVGCHKTNDINDGYMGSGTHLKHAQAKYGIENFSKEILHLCSNSDEMFETEAKIVTTEFVADTSTYNLKEGGSGGFDYINQNKLNTNFQNIDNARNGRMLANKTLEEKYGPDWRAHISKLAGQKMIEILELDPDFLKRKNVKSFLGKTHSDETKRKMSESSKGGGTGKLNSQYGKIWITDDTISKKIASCDPIPNGWRKGRKM
jgi:hypothetical protein